MNADETAALRQHYLKEMVERVSIVEGLIAVISGTEKELHDYYAALSQSSDPWYMTEQALKTNFTHQSNKGRRDRLREEAKMFALAAEALRP